MWQRLYTELQDQNFLIIAVAMDSRGVDAVRGPITRARTSYVSLVDPGHLVAELYHMVNVPQAVWIDEAGRIVRPTEVSGAAMSFNLLKLRKARRIYLEAVRDWVRHGEKSRHVFSPEQARAHTPTYTDDIAWAHVYFQLGRALWGQGKREEARPLLRKATELHPDSWNFFRQMKNLEHILGSGGPEFMSRVRRSRKAGKEYYPLPDMAGMESLAR